MSPYKIPSGTDFLEWRGELRLILSENPLALPRKKMFTFVNFTKHYTQLFLQKRLFLFRKITESSTLCVSMVTNNSVPGTSLLIASDR